MKVLKWIVLIVLILVIGAGVAVYFSLNRIIRTTVQSQTQKQLDVATALGGVNVSLFGGTLSLNDFSLGSPKGFSAPEMFSMDQASVDVKYGQLRENPIRIEDITIKKPMLTIEQADGKFNFKALMDQLPPSDPNAKPEGKSDAKPMQLIITKLTIDSPVVKLRPGVPGLAEEMTIPLQTITMENVGSGEGNENGAAVKDVLMKVINSIATEAAHSDKLPKELQTLLSLDTEKMAAELGKQVNEQVGKLTGELNKSLGKQLGGPTTNAVNDALKNVTGDQDAGQAVQKGIGDLLKGKDSKKK